MRILLIALASMLVAAVAAPPAVAQDVFSIELGGGADFATQDLGPSELDTGLGLEMMFGYRFLPHLSAYAGWGWNHFRADNFFTGADADAEETGYTAGLLFAHPLGSASLGYYVRAGAVYNHIEFENGDDLVADSGHGFGWQAGAGFVVPVGRQWNLLPGVRYRALSREVEVDGRSVDVDLSYVAARVGIMRTF